MSATWTSEALVAELSAMNWQLSQPVQSDAWRTYLQDYQLPLPQEAVQHFAGRMTLAEFEIIVQVWQPSQCHGAALILHGYYDHVGLYRHLIRYCLDRGWRVVTFDLPGHGLSSGERSSIQSFQQYDAVFAGVLEQVNQSFTEPLHLLGQSTGGAIIINYLLKRAVTPHQSPFASVNLIAPLVRPKAWRKAFWLHMLLRRWVRQIKRGRSVNSSDQSFLDFLWHKDTLQAGLLSMDWVGAMKEWVRFIERQPACDVPINIIQGDDDHTVEWRHNLKVLAEKFPLENELIIAGGRHHLVNETPEIRQQMWQALDEWIGKP